MAATTALAIDRLEVQYSMDGLKDVVITVSATLSGDVSGNTDSFTSGFNIASPDPSSFIEFEDLTESDVANFVKATDGYTSKVQWLTGELYKKSQPATEGMLPLPWDSEE